LKDGKVHRGMLGINIQNISDDTAKALELKDTSGVLVSNVQSGSAADKAGVKRGDIVTAINGEKIEDSNVLRNKVAGTPPGTAIKLTIVRDGNPQEVTATLDEFSGDAKKGPNQQGDDENAPASGSENGKLGITLQPLTPQVAKQLGISSDTGGLVVTDIDPNGPAAEEGISRGDVILEVNKQQVNSVADVQAALDKSGGKPVLLLVNSRGRTVYLTVRPE
ncbi:MAG: PDZ domain-containing protein, partial [Candidatus Binatia bacterium]